MFANGFAALSELEHTMRPDPQPPYVDAKTGWTNVEKATEKKPYDEVYLLDTQNLSGDATKQVEDIYDMVADILFEDFGSSDFASRKRSTAVNKQQHKAGMFRPPLGDGRDQGAMAFAQNYSAVGQSIIATTGSLELEAAVSDASRTMLEAFFSLAESSGGRQPNVKDRDAFLKSRLFLTTTMFDDFPEFLKPRPPAIVSYELVEHLMKSADGSSIHGRLMNDLSVEFRALREQAREPKDWASQAEKIRARYESEVLSRAGSSSIRLDELESARNHLFRVITADDGGLKQALYNLVDDREHGGLDFTIALVKQVRDELAKDQTGIRAQLDQAATQLRAVADDIMSRHLLASLKRLERAAKPGLFSGADRQSAEEYLKQIEADLGEGLKYWLRASAANEALNLLNEVAIYLGEQSTPDEKGEVTWTGLLRELDEGRRAVKGVINMVAAEASRVRDAINRPDHGVYIVIDRGAGRIAEERVRVEPREWAKERFSDFKGCRGIFPRLRNDQERLKLINQLRAIAKEKLAGEEAKIPSATQALCSLDSVERGKIFARLLKRSMPWYPGQFDRFKPKGDRFTMIIAAPESTSPQYRPVLDELIATNLPGFGIEPTIEDSSSRGKIICYCELSGLPLDSVQPLRDEWRKSYTKQETTRGRLPLHNHRDFLRFPNPIVPSPGEITQLRQKITLFLKGVLYGVLRRSLRSETGEDLRYYLDMSHNDFQSVGTERKIRARDFIAIHEAAIAKKVEETEAGFSALRWAAASALARWTAYRAYTPIREIDEATDQEQEYPGLGFQVAAALAEELKERAKACPDAKTLPLPIAELQLKLQERVEAFTIPVLRSLDDVDASEVNKAPMVAEFRATDKRRIDPEKFTDAHLASLLAEPSAAAAPAAMPPPPPNATVSYFVAMDGKTTGPFGLAELGEMSRDRALTPATLVYDANGGSDWVPAGTVEALSILFKAQPPPPPPGE